MKSSKKEESAKAGFVTKASARYCDVFPLRAAIQSVPGLGSALDTMLAGRGAGYQFKRLEHFIGELDQRMKRIEELKAIEPTEPLYDFMMQVFDEVTKTRSEEKRRRFANLVANQVVRANNWDEAETASRLLADLTEVHVRLLNVALTTPICDGVFKGLRIFMVTDFEMKDAKEIPATPPTNISSQFPELSEPVLKMICSELIAKGLVLDEGIGRFGTRNMQYFVGTEMAQWLMDWICEPMASCEDNRK